VNLGVRRQSTGRLERKRPRLQALKFSPVALIASEDACAPVAAAL